MRVSVDVPLADAVLGGTLRVPTLGGAVEMKLPPGAQGGKTLRLKGKGLPLKSGAGDLLVRLNIQIPKNDKELEALMRKRREANAGRELTIAAVMRPQRRCLPLLRRDPEQAGTVKMARYRMPKAFPRAPARHRSGGCASDAFSACARLCLRARYGAVQEMEPAHDL